VRGTPLIKSFLDFGLIRKVLCDLIKEVEVKKEMHSSGWAWARQARLY